MLLYHAILDGQIHGMVWLFQTKNALFSLFQGLESRIILVVLSAGNQEFKPHVNTSDMHGMAQIVWFKYLVNNLFILFELLSYLFGADSSWTYFRIEKIDVKFKEVIPLVGILIFVDSDYRCFLQYFNHLKFVLFPDQRVIIATLCDLAIVSVVFYDFPFSDHF